MNQKMYAFIIDPVKEDRIRKKILRILGRQRNGVKYLTKQSALQKMIGCDTRAAYLKYLLEEMQAEKLIMQDSRESWALWDSKSSIEQREWWEKRRIEHEAWLKELENSPAAIARRKEEAARRAQLSFENFVRRLKEHFVENELALLEAAMTICNRNKVQKVSAAKLTYDLRKSR